MFDTKLKFFGGRGKPGEQGRPERHSPTVRPTAPRSASEWAKFREPGGARDTTLSAVAQAWLADLPERVQPTELCSRYPRVANRLALCWNDPALSDRVFDDLMIDHRGTRQGFPPAVAAELMTLRNHHNLRNRSGPANPWDLQDLAIGDR